MIRAEISKNGQDICGAKRVRQYVQEKVDKDQPIDHRSFGENVNVLESENYSIEGNE